MLAFGSNTVSITVLERTLNRWIDESTAAKQHCAKMAGQSMHIDVDGTQLQLSMRALSDRVTLDTTRDQDATDVSIRAKPLDFVQLARAQAMQDIGAAHVEVRGSLGVAENFSRLLKLAKPSFEDELAGWVGGIPAHRIASVLGAAARWGARSINALEQNFSEYLLSESQAVPARSDIELFAVDVERTRDDVARFEQRLQRLLAVITVPRQ